MRKFKVKTKNEVTLQQIKAEIFSVPIPEWSRLGQFVFNRANELYGNVARQVQYLDNVDCYYHDDQVDNFINKVWNRLKKETVL